MKFIVNIRNEGSAFDGNADETARILRNLAQRVSDCDPMLRDEEDPFALLDENGNTVGTAYFTEED